MWYQKWNNVYDMNHTFLEHVQQEPMIWLKFPKKIGTIHVYPGVYPKSIQISTFTDPNNRSKRAIKVLDAKK